MPKPTPDNLPWRSKTWIETSRLPSSCHSEWLAGDIGDGVRRVDDGHQGIPRDGNEFDASLLRDIHGMPTGASHLCFVRHHVADATRGSTILDRNPMASLLLEGYRHIVHEARL